MIIRLKRLTKVKLQKIYQPSNQFYTRLLQKNIFSNPLLALNYIEINSFFEKYFWNLKISPFIFVPVL